MGEKRKTGATIRITTNGRKREKEKKKKEKKKREKKGKNY